MGKKYPKVFRTLLLEHKHESDKKNLEFDDWVQQPVHYHYLHEVYSMLS